MFHDKVDRCMLIIQFQKQVFTFFLPCFLVTKSLHVPTYMEQTEILKKVRVL